jgi:hypothetical protein
VYAFPQKGQHVGPMIAAANPGPLHWASAWRVDCAGFKRVPLSVPVLGSLRKYSLGDCGMSPP